jgi:hypothetical protein
VRHIGYTASARFGRQNFSPTSLRDTPFSLTIIHLSCPTNAKEHICVKCFDQYNAILKSVLYIYEIGTTCAAYTTMRGDLLLNLVGLQVLVVVTMAVKFNDHTTMKMNMRY